MTPHDFTSSAAVLSPGDEDWLLIARRVLLGDPGTVGLIPVGRDIDTGALLIPLARATGTLLGRPPALVERWSRWGQSPYGSRVVEGDITVISPPAAPDAVVAAQTLTDALPLARRSFGRVLIDLAGLVPGFGPAARLADAHLLVARAGRAREDELARLHALLPPGRPVGVLLTE